MKWSHGLIAKVLFDAMFFFSVFNEFISIAYLVSIFFSVSFRQTGPKNDTVCKFIYKMTIVRSPHFVQTFSIITPVFLGL